MLCPASVTKNRIMKADPQALICSPAVPNPSVFCQIPDRGQMSSQSDGRNFGIGPITVGEQVIDMAIGGIYGRIQNGWAAEGAQRQKRNSEDRSEEPTSEPQSPCKLVCRSL